MFQDGKDLVKDLTYLSGTIEGAQQIRLDMGHALFGARVEFGDPLFLTVSPSSRHSGRVCRLSRYRNNDPAIIYDHTDHTKYKGTSHWTTANKPSLWTQ